jgi:hypothetical protein
MVTAAAIKVGAMNGKPKELADVVELLVRGAGDKKAPDASDSEYIEEQWWGSDGDSDDEEQPT